LCQVCSVSTHDDDPVHEHNRCLWNKYTPDLKGKMEPFGQACKYCAVVCEHTFKQMQTIEIVKAPT
jgi:hypothetical protein